VSRISVAEKCPRHRSYTFEIYPPCCNTGEEPTQLNQQASINPPSFSINTKIATHKRDNTTPAPLSSANKTSAPYHHGKGALVCLL